MIRVLFREFTVLEHFLHTVVIDLMMNFQTKQFTFSADNKRVSVYYVAKLFRHLLEIDGAACTLL